MDVASAIAAISGAGLQAIPEWVPSGTVPAGTVIPGSQSPAGGTVVSPGTPQAQVFFQVSSGPGGSPTTVTVPNLLGISVLAARAALQKAYLSAGMISFAVSSSPEGTVTAQSVASGSNVSVATIVNMTVSGGPNQPADTVSVPSIS